MDGSSVKVQHLRRRGTKVDNNWRPPKLIDIDDTEFPFNASGTGFRVPFDRIALIEFDPGFVEFAPGSRREKPDVTVTLRTGEKKQGVAGDGGDSFRGFVGYLEKFRIFVSTYYDHRIRSVVFTSAQ